MARPDFRSTAARRLAEERELSPAVLSLLSPEGTDSPPGIRNIPLDRITPNPEQPRMNFDEDALAELAASITRARRPPADPGSPNGRSPALSSWSPASVAGARPERLDSRTSLRSSSSSTTRRRSRSGSSRTSSARTCRLLKEAMIYDRMTHEHGYSVRRLAQKLGKDKGYIENRLRWPVRRPRSSSWCLCAKTRCHMPTSSLRWRTPRSDASLPSRWRPASCHWSSSGRRSKVEPSNRRLRACPEAAGQDGLAGKKSRRLHQTAAPAPPQTTH